MPKALGVVSAATRERVEEALAQQLGRRRGQRLIVGVV
jgi:hypothetical protein